MSRRHWMHSFAVRGCLIAAILALPVVSHSQESTPESAAPIEEDQGIAPDAPTPEENPQEQPAEKQEPTAETSQGVSPIQKQGSAEETCDEHCQAAEQREIDDLIAQESMARATWDLVDLTFWQVFVAAVGLSLLVWTLKLTRDSVKVAAKANEAAEISAGAAQAAVEVTQNAAEAQLRAFVFGQGFSQGLSLWDGAIRDYLVFVKLENAGLTPAIDVCSWIEYKSLNINEEKTFVKTGVSISTVLGPRSTAQTQYITIPLQTMVECWQNKKKILVWSRVEYKDTFNPKIIHHHEQCASIKVMHDPKDIPPEGHPPYITLGVYGPQNTSS